MKKYAFLSNFYPCDVLYSEVIFPSLENAYQAAKYSGEDALNVCQEFAGFTPGKAKRKGRKLPLRNDWDKSNLK